MKVYNLYMKLESPLICTEEQIGNVLVHTGLSLKGHTIRGGFLGMLYMYNPNKVIEESNNPQLVFHPAYPIFEGLKSEPTHPFIYSCKICKEIKEENPYLLLKELENSRIPEFASCKKGHVLSLKTQGGSLMIKRNGHPEIKKLEYTSIKSVGINRILKGSEHEMLYEYVALSPGLEFEGRIIDLSNRIEELGLIDEDEIIMGRGRTRGFGKVKVKVSPVGDDIVDKRTTEIKDILKKRDGIIILRAISLTCRFKRNSDGIYTVPFPSITEEQIKPIELPILNGNSALTSVEEFSGFSNVSKLPVPKMIGAGAGSLFFYRVDENYWEDASKYLAERELLGFGPFSFSGLNILEVYDIE